MTDIVKNKNKIQVDMLVLQKMAKLKAKQTNK